MNHKLQKLAARRRHLITQASSQRQLLTHDFHSWHQPLATLDKVLATFRYIKHHPIYVAGGGAAILSMAKPSGIGKWYRRCWLAWQILNKFRNKYEIRM
jgi:hypothetical protein